MLLVPPMVSGLQATLSMLMGRRYGLGTPAVQAQEAACGSFLAMLSQKPIFLAWQRCTALAFGHHIVNPLKALVLAAHEGLKYLYSEAMCSGGLREELGKMRSGCQCRPSSPTSQPLTWLS